MKKYFEYILSLFLWLPAISATGGAMYSPDNSPKFLPQEHHRDARVVVTEHPAVLHKKDETKQKFSNVKPHYKGPIIASERPAPDDVIVTPFTNGGKQYSGVVPADTAADRNALIDAVRRGDFAEVRRLVGVGVATKGYTDDAGDTLVTIARAGNHPEILEYLSVQ